MTTPRIAQIGCGGQGRGGHLEAYRQAIAEGDDLAVVAVCDADPARARDAAELFPGARWYVDYREMLAREQPDAVSIATPAAYHHEQTLAAFAAGAHVLCEKPLAMNAAQAREMVAAAECAGRVLSMGLQCRYILASGYLRDLVARRELGQVYHTRVWCQHVWSLPPAPHFLRQAPSGGGVVASTTVHFFDLALWILGNPPVATVSASGFAKAPRLGAPPPPFHDRPDGPAIVAAQDVEDFAFALVRFQDGSTLSAESSWLAHPSSRPTGLHLLAEHGAAEWLPLAVRYDGGGQIEDRTPPGVSSSHGTPHFLATARDFLRGVRTGWPTVITGPQMIQVQEVIDAVYASLRSQREVSL